MEKAQLHAAATARRLSTVLIAIRTAHMREYLNQDGVKRTIFVHKGATQRTSSVENYGGLVFAVRFAVFVCSSCSALNIDDSGQCRALPVEI